jgi:DNA repair photolyase
MGFWSINPYVGCEFGCSYCYARFAHRYAMERAYDAGQLPVDASQKVFEHHIFVKQRRAVLTALARDLARVCTKNRSSYPVVIGTATDPYQPAERRFQITRTILERLLDTSGLDLALMTKSPLVCRDIDLLRKLGRKHAVTVYITLISTNMRVTKLFEARSPVPHVRLRAIRKLRDADIAAGINAAPVLPGITDSATQIDALMAAAADANAAFVRPSPIRLPPAARETFLPIIKQHFPDLMPRYLTAFRGSWEAPSGYTEAVQRRFQRIARKYGIAAADALEVKQERQPEREVQLSLL